MKNSPTRADLAAFFRPRNVALVGASDRSAWSQSIFTRFGEYQHQGKLFAVNRTGAPAHGLPGYTGIAAIPEPIDTAYIYVPAAAVVGALRDAAAAGVRNVVVLSSGFAEAGDDGVVLQAELVAAANETGVMLLGPNSLGFANYAGNAFCTSIRSRLPIRKGGLAIVSQSGAIGVELAKWAHAQAIGLSFLCATGNEAQLGIANLLDYLIDDPATHAIALYVEGIKDPESFMAAAARARHARKPVVLLKVGRSAISGAVVQAHTGSLVGDDRVFDAMCRRYGISRVTCIEELVATADFLGRIGPIDPPNIGMASISGGACGMYADLAEIHGLDIAPFVPATQDALRAVLPTFASTLNPLDVTGVAIQDTTLWTQVLPIVTHDPGMGLVVASYNIPNTALDRKALDPTFAAIAAGYRAAGKPSVILSFSVHNVSEEQEALRSELGLDIVLPNLDLGVRALAHLANWSKALLRPDAASVPAAGSAPVLIGERAVLSYLATRGVPVIPAHLATTCAEAAAFARQLDGPVVLKIASPDLAHKSEAGGVKLNLLGDAAVGQAYDAIHASVSAYAPHARIDGVIVSPMRDGGAELIVGMVRDPQWGPVLVTGLGGFFAEALEDSQLCLLPATPSDVRTMLEGLRGVKVLQGFRGNAPADFDVLARAIAAIGDAALALGPDLAALEVNPLRVAGDQIECLDGLAIYADND